ncbi:MAG TPA: GNAT family N-acetyltransferase [Burkholderiales bacterium]|nr:GNAT family N-acetyltransferase [Burkholderiales bacterium]
MRIIQCTREEHAAAILYLLNDAIVNSTALYDYKPRSAESMGVWFDDKVAGSFPVLGAQSATGELLGFATYGGFRPHSAYRYTIEHSVYVHPDHRRTGLAATLMQALISEARRQEYHVMVGGIDGRNAASIGLHEKLGFTRAGTLHHAGFKFGRWLDLVFFQLILDTPQTPVESSRA